jgi:hypothetical protein
MVVVVMMVVVACVELAVLVLVIMPFNTDQPSSGPIDMLCNVPDEHGDPDSINTLTVPVRGKLYVLDTLVWDLNAPSTYTTP